MRRTASRAAGDGAWTPPQPAAATGPSGRAAVWWRLLPGVALITGAVLWVYSPVFHGDWLWDDDLFVTDNPTVQSQSLAGLWNLWIDPDGIDYFPLSYTMMWLQWPFFGSRPTGYHVTSILLHALSSLLVWMLFRRLRIPRPFLGGLLFAVHPLAVESVAWISEIKNTLSMPFFLLSCICWVTQDEAADSAADRGPARLAYPLSILFFLLAMLAKTSMVALPVVLLVHAWWRRGSITRGDLVKTAPCFAISLVLGLVTIAYQHGRAMDDWMPIAEIWTLEGLLQRTALAGMAILFYLSKVIVPIGLMPQYPQWEVPRAWQFLAWPAMAAAMPWILSTIGTAARPGWGRHVAFGLGFFLLMVAPVLGFVTIAYMRITWVADHFIYLPMLGVIAPLVGAAGAWYDAVAVARRPPLLAAAALTLAALAFWSHGYARVWKDEDTLWNYTLAHNENAWNAHNRLGVRKRARNDFEGARHHFSRAAALRPNFGETLNNLGVVFDRDNRLDEAIVHFARARRLMPRKTEIHVNLVAMLGRAGRPEEAAEAVRGSLEFFKLDAADPAGRAGRNDPGGHLRCAEFLTKLGLHQAAIGELEQALRRQPDRSDVHVALGKAQQAAAAAQPPPETP